ncbi:nicotinate-nucleotide--dimethylbenzimidazole phosphoribosyltransferase [Streptomyces sp. NPDC050287]|uniref:nicotinate-nucleotide--dimethylbenzimidazole phosphoribosyltransferase n=1 Tax=Streptomyces sp. NPDC050287 TaxID=3365608 RepID=UPI0037B7E804
MTDTGQIPAEGLPENAGMVDQPGASAHGAYTYLSETTAEDEDLLLLPGAQGAWGNEVPPPAPEPVVEAVHEPGPHEISGRDSGSVDLSAVRLPNPPVQPAMPNPPRRPLHLGPPIPDTSASPVRSLADRGAVGAPVRHSGPPTTDPEYLDVPQPREMSPQGATPWGAPTAVQTEVQGAVQSGVQAPVSAEATAAETVVPVEGQPVESQPAEPTDPAQTTAAEAAPVRPSADPGVGPQSTESGFAPQPQPQFADAGLAVPGHEAELHAQPPQGGETPLDGAAEPGAASAQTWDADGSTEGAYAPDAVAQPTEGAEVPGTGQTPEGAYGPDGGQLPVGAPVADAGPLSQSTRGADAGHLAAGAHGPDAGQLPGAPAPDAGQPSEGAPASEGEQLSGAVPVSDTAQNVTATEPGPDVAPGPDSEPGAVAAVGDDQTPGAEADADTGEVPATTAVPDAGQDEAGADGPGALAVGPGEGAPGAVAPAPGDLASGAVAPDAGQLPEDAVAPDTGQLPEGPVAPDAAQRPEGVPVEDAGQRPDSADVAEPVSAVAASEPAPHGDPASGAAPTGIAPTPEAGAPEPAIPDDGSAPTAGQLPEADAMQAPGADSAPVTHSTSVTHPTPDAGTSPATEQIPSAAPASDPGQPPEAAAVAPGAPRSPEAVPFPAAPDPAHEARFTDGTPAPFPDTEGTAAAMPHDASPQQAMPEHAVPDPGRTPTARDVHQAQGPQLAPAMPVMDDAPHPADSPAHTPVGLAAEQPPAQAAEYAPTPPRAFTLPPEDQSAPEPVTAVPTPRDGDPQLTQHAEDLATRAADQEDQEDQRAPHHQRDPHDPQHPEEESTAAVEDVRPSTGPAAPAYDDAEREAVLKVMRERRDIRNGFRSDPIPHEVLLRVLEAAHTAPSVGHSQPWDFVVIRSAGTRRSMHELAMRQRDAYAKSLPKGRAKQFKELKIEAILDTPVNIVVTADPTRGGRHTLGRHTQPQMAPYSAALAVENLWLAARAEGLGVGWVSFFDEREMVRALGLPEHLEVIAYLCVGYVDEFPDEPELMQAGWSKRRPLSWVVHEETYGRRALPGEEPHDLLAETVAQIRPLDAKALGEAWERQKRMTKPAGALGMLEIISAQLSGLSRQCPPPIPEPAAVAIFAGDHGVHAQGVTPWPQEVTAQMVANFLGGGAVCNAFASQVGAEVCVVDVGVASDLPATPGLLPRKIRAGTSDMTTGPAMTREEAKQAIEVGIETARDLVAAGNKALLTGEMGIANTTASAALISVFTGADPAEVTGRGTGINDETLARKTEVVRRALDVHQPDPADPIGVLAAVGGFEHAAMVGLLLGGASLRTPVILDGVSAGAAALVARAIAPEVLAACIAGHRSAEPGHVAALNKLGLRPLVDLDLRLGEGTGALLALPLVQSTARAMHEVATFDSAGVTEK